MKSVRHQCSTVVENDREIRQAGRMPGDDFFCLRFGVWYPSLDCAVRTKFRTAPGCLDCDQGRFNLRRHDRVLGRARFDLALVRD